MTNDMNETLMWLPRIYRALPIGLCCFDTNLRYVHINEWLAAINGLSVEEHLGRTISEVVPDVAEGVSAELRQVIETGKPVLDGKFAATTPAQQGTKRIFRHNYLPVTSDDGIIVGVSCCVEEITELERKEVTLQSVVQGTATQTGRDFFGSLVKHLAIAIGVRIAFISEISESHDPKSKKLRTLAYWTGTELGDNLEYDIRGTPCEYVIDKGLALFSEGVQEHFPNDIWLKEKGIQSYLGIPLFDLSGNAIGHLGVAHSEPLQETILPELVLRAFAARATAEVLRLRAEESLRWRESELAHVARLNMMGEMVGGIAHEINQPLFAISNFASACELALTQRGADQIEKLIGMNHHIAEQAVHAGEILKRLRSFVSKSERRCLAFDINDVISESIELTASQAGRFDATVRLALADNLHNVAGDSVQIQQVLVNLLLNAFECMVSKSPEERVVTVCTSLMEDGIEVSVEDSGEGLSPELKDTVFDAFFTTKTEGMGLGLAISRSIIEAHDGRIWVTPKSERGSTFHFKLPVVTEGLSHVE